MSGLRRICKLYGSMKCGGVMYVWDYAADEPVKEAEMPFGSERWKASERARYSALSQPDPSEPEGGLDA